MGRPTNPLSRLLQRWSGQQETALHQFSGRKTVGARLAGCSKSERADAKFLLFAMVPFVPLIISDQLGWGRGTLWLGWFWISATWAAVVFGLGFTAYWRALRRSKLRKR
jgi:hypothetical protein